MEGTGGGDYFGTSIAISASGNVVAVGSKWNDDGPGSNAGQVRVFEYSQAT